MIRLLYIARYPALAVLLLLLLALAPARAQSVVYQGEITTLDVVQKPGDSYIWELYLDSTVNFAVVPGDCPASDAEFVGGNTGPSVNVHWKETGIYFYKVTGMNASGCTMNLKVGMMKVIKLLPTAVLEPPEPVCLGDIAKIKVRLTGIGPWDITYTNGISSWKISGITDPDYEITVKTNLPVSNWWISSVRDQNGTNFQPTEKVELDIKPRPEFKSRIYVYNP